MNIEDDFTGGHTTLTSAVGSDVLAVCTNQVGGEQFHNLLFPE